MSQEKHPAFEKILLPEFQSSDFENCLFYTRYVELGSAIYPVLIGHSFSSKWEIFCSRPLSKTCKTSENSEQDFPSFSFLAIITLACVHVFCPIGRMESPLNKIFILGGRLFKLPKGKHVLTHAESHRYEVSTLEILACNFNTFCKVSQRDLS